MRAGFPKGSGIGEVQRWPSRGETQLWAVNKSWRSPGTTAHVNMSMWYERLKIYLSLMSYTVYVSKYTWELIKPGIKYDVSNWAITYLHFLMMYQSSSWTSVNYAKKIFIYQLYYAVYYFCFLRQSWTTWHSKARTTNRMSLGRGYLFAWPMAIRKSIRGNLSENSHYFSTQTYWKNNISVKLYYVTIYIYIYIYCVYIYTFSY